MIDFIYYYILQLINTYWMCYSSSLMTSSSLQIMNNRVSILWNQKVFDEPLDEMQMRFNLTPGSRSSNLNWWKEWGSTKFKVSNPKCSRFSFRYGHSSNFKWWTWWRISWRRKRRKYYWVDRGWENYYERKDDLLEKFIYINVT